MTTASLVIKVDSSGARTASRDLDRLTDQAGKSERSAHKMGKAWGVALGLIGSAAVVGGIRAVIKNTIEQERVTAQLEARLKSTGNAAGLTKDQLLDMASGLQAVTTFGDEAVIEAQSLLLTFTKIGRDVFPQATETVLDMSTALGQGLKESAIQLGKALNDPIQGVTALRRVGVQLSESQEDLIKKLVETGQTAEAQRVILAELETQMGGSARAARDTLGGAIEGLKNAFGDLLEGDSGGEGIKGTQAAIEALTATLSSPSTQQAFQSFINGLAEMANTAIIAIGRINELRQAANIGAAGGALGSASEGAASERLAQINKRLRDIEAARSGDPRAASRIAMTTDLTKPGQWTLGGQESALQAERTRIMQELQERRINERRASWQANFIPDRFVPEGGGSGGGGGKTKSGGKGRSAPDFAKDAARELRELVEAEAQARKSFDALEAQLAGPLSQAAYTYSIRQQELNDLAKAGAIDSDRLTAAKENLRAEYEADVAAINALRTPAQRMLEDMQFELSLYGLSNVEREKAIALRYAEANAASAQGKAITDLVERLEQAREAERYIDGMKGAFVDFGVEALSSFDSIADAAEQFADRIKRMALQLLMEKAVQWLFSMFTGGGSNAAQGASNPFVGDKWSAWGGGFSGGGYTGSGGKYEPAGIVHKGEYVINADSTRKLGRGYLDQLNGYANGGLVGGGPAKGGGVEVRVINNSGTPARTQESTGADGRKLIEVIVGEVDRRIGNMGSTGKAMSQRFGLQPVGVSRG